MKTNYTKLVNLVIAATALTTCAAAVAQVEPAAFGASAKFDYGLSYYQTAQFDNDYGDTRQNGAVDGELEYMNGKPHKPFSTTYSGGYQFGISGPSNTDGLFQHLKVSQGYFRRNWGVNISDDVSYSPETPTSGFSGIPGIGSLPGEPEPGGPILESHTLYNSLNGLFTRSINYNTTFRFDSTYMILRYPNAAATETNDLSLRPQINWRLNPLNTAIVQYSYSHFTYVGQSFALDTESVEPGIFRIWNRRLTTTVMAGPEWVHSSESLLIPSSTGIAASASVGYQQKAFSSSLVYARQVTSGAGYGSDIGIHNDDASFNISHNLTRDLTISGNASYMRSEGLAQPGITISKYGGVSLSRRIGEFWSVGASYTAVDQTSSLTLPTAGLSGLYQVVAFSISYHPRENHIIRK